MSRSVKVWVYEHISTSRSAGGDPELTVDVESEVPSRVLEDPAGRDRVEP
ncbi:MAG: hypothetical protein WBH75_19065 [Thermoanaerobaculia bacterium]